LGRRGIGPSANDAAGLNAQILATGCGATSQAAEKVEKQIPRGLKPIRNDKK
jgi:hypothetical protein